jgi:hypothetical protein
VQTAGAFVAEQVGNVFAGLVPIVRIQFRYRKVEGEIARVLDRLIREFPRQRPGCVERPERRRFGYRAPRHRREHRRDPGIEFVERLIPEYHQRHLIGRIVGFVKRDQVAAHVAAQGVEAADRELRRQMGWIDQLFVDVERTPAVVFQIELILRIDRVFFPFDVRRIERRRNEELRKTVQPPRWSG